PANDAAVSPRVSVTDKDIDNVEVLVPGEREILGIITVEGRSAIPGFQLELNAAAGGMLVRVQPERNGTFRVKLPTDERRVRINGLPIGYVVKVMTYGAADLLTQPLNLTEALELHIALSVDPDVKPGSVKGRVIGLDPNHGSVQIVLNGVTAF